MPAAMSYSICSFDQILIIFNAEILELEMDEQKNPLEYNETPKMYNRELKMYDLEKQEKLDMKSLGEVYLKCNYYDNMRPD